MNDESLQQGNKPSHSRKNMIIVLILLFAVPITVLLAQTFQQLLSKASSSQAVYMFVPLTGAMPPDQNVQVMLSTRAITVNFVSTVILFDNKKIQLASEITPSTSLKTVKVITSMAEANASGIIEIAVQTLPGDIPPSGLIDIATLPFTTVSSLPNDTTELTINTSDGKILDTQRNQVTPVAKPLPFYLNGFGGSVSPTIQTSQQSGSVFMSVRSPPLAYPQQKFTSTILLNTNKNPLVGVDFVIGFDASYLELDSVTTSVFSQKHSEEIDNTYGTYKVSMHVASGEEPVNGSSLIPITLHFTPKEAGSAAIGVSSETVIAGTGTTGQNLTLYPQASGINIRTLVPTSTMIPTPFHTPVSFLTPTSVLTPRQIFSPTSTIVPYKPADINQDRAVDIGDYLLLLADYGKRNPTRVRADVNQDGIVNIKDYAIMYESFDF
jgi:hypothetical protein